LAYDLKTDYYEIDSQFKAIKNQSPLVLKKRVKKKED